MTNDGLARECWSATGGRLEALDRLEILDPGAWLGGPLAVDDLAIATIGTALLAASELAEARSGRLREVVLSAEHAALSFQSELHARLSGKPIRSSGAPLSRFMQCASGHWARTHGTYPHHAAALLRALNVDINANAVDAPAVVERALRSMEATAVEEAVMRCGGCATAVRPELEWAAHPVGRAARSDPLIAWDDEIVTVGKPLPDRRYRRRGPADGIRVLDLTRVIAGPVAGRTLAALGAEVLRVDPPGLPELAYYSLDTSPGKRSAVLDLGDRDRRERLLAQTDVVLAGYRSGSLRPFGLEADQLAARHPQIALVSLSAWGANGPWSDRRGFDSLVQAACGIATISARDGAPGQLPAQALDHGTGHLMAAAALRALTRRAVGQEHSPARLSLLRTASTLLDAPRSSIGRSELTGAADPGRYLVRFGRLQVVSPPGMLDGSELRWRHGPRPFGKDQAAWS